jgi:trk system potassium uptake protein TrkH
MNYGMVARVIGNLLLLEAAVFSLPLGVSLYFKEREAVLGFLLAMGVVGLVGLFLSNVKKESAQLRTREAVLIVTLGWTLTSFFGALPFVFSGSVPSLIDAFFEAVSGFTTTGSTIIGRVEELPRGILFWRSFTHWLGGMGILVLTLAILPTLGAGGQQVFRIESPGPAPDKFTPRVVATSKILYSIYLFFTVGQIVLLRWSGLPWFESFLWAFGTVSTGGLGLYSDSMVRYGANGFLITVTAIGMVLSGVNFSLYYDLGKRRFDQVFKDSELRLYLALLLAATFFVSLSLYGEVYSSVGEAVKQAFFQVSSIMTTTGYATADYDLWPAFSKGVLFFLMFVGGSAGSTSGGIKVIRFVVARQMIHRELARIVHPKAAAPITVAGKVVSPDVVKGVASFYLLYFAFFGLGALIISLENVDPLSAMTAAAATLGNIGPGLGMAGPMQTYAPFSPFSKIVLSFLMLLGRLELFTLLLVFTPSFWRE